jgi:hypothetical protein
LQQKLTRAEVSPLPPPPPVVANTIQASAGSLGEVFDAIDEEIVPPPPAVIPPVPSVVKPVTSVGRRKSVIDTVSVKSVPSVYPTNISHNSHSDVSNGPVLDKEVIST